MKKFIIAFSFLILFSCNSSDIKIEEISFFGESIQYKITLLNSDLILRVSEMYSREGIEWKVKDCVSVSWTLESLFAFK